MFEKESEEEINKIHWNYSIFKDLAQEYWQKGAEFGYNKAKEEMREQGLALQSDMDKTIEQNIVLKKQIEKMKCWKNCQTWNEWQCPHARNGIKDYVEPLDCPCNKWKLRG